MYGIPIGKLTLEVSSLIYKSPEVLLGSENYTTKIQSWAFGCIIAEMIIGKPLFNSDSEIGQLFQIFQILGTPTEITWPDIINLPNYKKTFPKWNTNKLRSTLGEDTNKEAIDLIEKLLVVDPDKRITIREAMEHPFLEKNKNHRDK